LGANAVTAVVYQICIDEAQREKNHAYELVCILTPSAKFVWYLAPLLHLIGFKVNKVNFALEMHLKTFTVSTVQGI
jgi:hypothetical protein